MDELGEKVGAMNYSSVSTGKHRCNEKIQTEQTMNKQMGQILQLLNVDSDEKVKPLKIRELKSPSPPFKTRLESILESRFYSLTFTTSQFRQNQGVLQRNRM